MSGHLVMAVLLCAAIRFDIAAFTLIAFVPWALMLTRLCGTCIGLFAFDFVRASESGKRNFVQGFVRSQRALDSSSLTTAVNTMIEICRGTTSSSICQSDRPTNSDGGGPGVP